MVLPEYVWNSLTETRETSSVLFWVPISLLLWIPSLLLGKNLLKRFPEKYVMYFLPFITYHIRPWLILIKNRALMYFIRAFRFSGKSAEVEVIGRLHTCVLLEQKIVCEDKSQVNLGHVQVKKYANVISCLANHKRKSHARTEDAYINKFCFSVQLVWVHKRSKQDVNKKIKLFTLQLTTLMKTWN